MVSLLDTHQHLIYPDVAGYDWTDDIPVLSKQAFSLEDYYNLVNSDDVDSTIFMEAGVNDADYQKEIRFVAELANDPASRIVGLIASCRPETNDGFESWLDECDSLNVVGFRRILHVMPDELSKSTVFRQNVRKIGTRGLVFDMCFFERQLPIAIELAKACENTCFVLDHCGVPDIAGGSFEQWRKHIVEIADISNVCCKLSGIMAYCSAGNSSLESIKPYVDHVIDKFGTDRIVWGSDWPVVNMANGLSDWVRVTHEILQEFSESEAKKIAQNNAKRIYNLNF